jgi:hypothetical protein
MAFLSAAPAVGHSIWDPVLTTGKQIFPIRGEYEGESGSIGTEIVFYAVDDNNYHASFRIEGFATKTPTVSLSLLGLPKISGRLMAGGRPGLLIVALVEESDEGRSRSGSLSIAADGTYTIYDAPGGRLAESPRETGLVYLDRGGIVSSRITTSRSEPRDRIWLIQAEASGKIDPRLALLVHALQIYEQVEPLQTPKWFNTVRALGPRSKPQAYNPHEDRPTP